MAAAQHLLLVSEDQGNTSALAKASASLAQGHAVTWICSTQASHTLAELEATAALKNNYMSALNLLVITRQESQPFTVLTGELNQDRINRCADLLFEEDTVTQVALAGSAARQEEFAHWLNERMPTLDPELLEASHDQNNMPAASDVTAEQTTDSIAVTVILQGRELQFDMARNSGTLLDGAEDAGIDLPFSCRGGVCSSCRARLRHGSVELAENYALEDWELDSGFTLPCQAEPVSDQITLDYDEV